MIYYAQISKCRRFCIEKRKILPVFLGMISSHGPFVDVNLNKARYKHNFTYQIYLKLLILSRFIVFCLNFYLEFIMTMGSSTLANRFIKMIYMWGGMQSQCSIVALWQSGELNSHGTSTITLFRSACVG